MKYVIYDQQGIIEKVYIGSSPELQGYDYYPKPRTVIDEDGEEQTDIDRLAEDVNDETHYMDLSDEPTLRAKTAYPITIDKTTASVGEPVTLSGIKTGSTVTMKGGDATDRIKSDEDVAISFDAPDDYTITVSHPYHLPSVQKVIIE